MKEERKLLKRIELICFFVIFFALTGLLVYQLDKAFYQLLGKPQSNNDLTENIEIPDLLQPGQLFLTQGAEKSAEYIRLTEADGYYQEAYGISSALVKSVLQVGIWERQEKIVLPDKRCRCVFVYDFTFEADFLELMGVPEQKEENLRAEEIWIYPSTTYQEDTEVYLINWRENVAWKISLSRRQGREQVQALLDFLYGPGEKMQREWICVQESLSGKFAENAFVRKEDVVVSLYPVEISSPVLREGRFLDENKVIQYCQRFFQNPDMILEFQNTREKITYMDEQATIQVSRDGLIRYTASYITEEATISLQKDFERAALFFEQDMAFVSEAVPEYRLVDYQATEKGYIFYFDYYFSGIRFVLGKEFLEEHKMHSAVEIEVRNGVIRAYRCLPIQKEATVDRMEVLEETWIGAVDRLSDLKRGLPRLTYQWAADGLYVSWNLPGEEGK